MKTSHSILITTTITHHSGEVAIFTTVLSGFTAEAAHIAVKELSNNDDFSFRSVPKRRFEILDTGARLAGEPVTPCVPPDVLSKMPEAACPNP